VLLNPAVLVVSGLSEVLGALGQILLSYLVHLHSSLRSLRQGQVHVGPITWEVLPQPGAPLLLYVVASHSAVSAALAQEKLDGQIKKQAPVYFVSEVLSLSKKNYTELEKVLYAVLMASRKLRHYFQAYHIIVPSSQPLKDIMRNREATEGLENGLQSLTSSVLIMYIAPQFSARR
jgi:hypothetical protein